MNLKGTTNAIKLSNTDHRDNIIVAITCLLLMLLFFNSACSTTTARSRGNASESLSADEFISLLRTQLDLTAMQELQIQSVIETDLQERKKIMVEFGTSRENRETIKAKFQNLKESTIASVEPFLSDEKLEKFIFLYEQKLPFTPPRSPQTGRKGRGGRSKN